MRREWEPEDLIACWTLGEADWKLLANKRGATRLGFALVLKFFELEARFPRHVGEREYAVTRGWLVTEFVDHASAADMAGRTAWRQLLEGARRRRVHHVMAWKLDRPFRSTLHCLRTLEDLDHRGVGFSCLTQEIDITSRTGCLLLTILAAVADLERGLISDRVREGMVNARRKGARIGRPAAAERPSVAVQLDGVLAELAEGEISKREACRRLRVGMATLERILGAPKGEPGNHHSGEFAEAP
jgi:DNA invertase Pin-like site-specific DNA recombinase